MIKIGQLFSTVFNDYLEYLNVFTTDISVRYLTFDILHLHHNIN